MLTLWLRTRPRFVVVVVYYSIIRIHIFDCKLKTMCTICAIYRVQNRYSAQLSVHYTGSTNGRVTRGEQNAILAQLQRPVIAICLYSIGCVAQCSIWYTYLVQTYDLCKWMRWRSAQSQFAVWSSTSTIQEISTLDVKLVDKFFKRFFMCNKSPYDEI